MGRSSKPRHAHRPRLKNIPMTNLRDQIGLELHVALAALSVAPAREQFDSIGQVLNIIGLTIEHDPRFPAEFRIIQGGASAMNQIADGWTRTRTLRPTDLELLPIRNAVNVCDEISSRLDLTKLHLSIQKLRVMTGVK
jgi:hypothetical protein